MYAQLVDTGLKKVAEASEMSPRTSNDGAVSSRPPMDRRFPKK